jgi:TatD DNase family protein
MAALTLIDTHAHLYSKQFKDERDDMIRRALAAGVSQMFLPNIDVPSIEPMLDLEAVFPGQCHAMMGLHPCSVEADYESVLTTIEAHLGARKWAGIGETGLDRHWDLTHFEQQRASFARHIEWAKDLGRPLIIHARKANEPCLELVKKGQDGRLRGIFHCFSGTLDEARQMVDLGFMLGIGGTITYPNAPDVREAVQHIGLEHIVLETDAPYLPPVPHRGKRNESAYIRLVADMVSEVKVLPITEVARVTTANALRMFA